jgi:NAD(P)-dependent dehydrogenase (short-subunit alcohol dehydrogenase family)
MLEDLFRLDNKFIVITGATGLLGRKHAKAIACYGAVPILLDLSQKKIDDFANELNDKYDANAIGFEVDITNEKMVKDNADKLIAKFGRIDGLVNNAANNPQFNDSSKKHHTRLENFSLDIWNQDLAVGLTGAFICCKHYGYQISKNKKGGSIVNISSDLGLIAPDQNLYSQKSLDADLQPVKPVSYSVVKTGIIGLTRYLATYWANKNVRCNAMCPGGVENNLSASFMKKVTAKIPMNRLAKANEYQGTLIWMLSDASSYLNGSIIAIDGGRTTW